MELLQASDVEPGECGTQEFTNNSRGQVWCFFLVYFSDFFEASRLKGTATHLRFSAWISRHARRRSTNLSQSQDSIEIIVKVYLTLPRGSSQTHRFQLNFNLSHSRGSVERIALLCAVRAGSAKPCTLLPYCLLPYCLVGRAELPKCFFKEALFFKWY